MKAQIWLRHSHDDDPINPYVECEMNYIPRVGDTVLLDIGSYAKKGFGATVTDIQWAIKPNLTDCYVVIWVLL